MIVVKPKSFEEIRSTLQGYKRILIVGCDGCAGIYETGGLKQAEILKERLELAQEIKGDRKISVRALTVLRQCDDDVVANSLREAVGEADAILSLGCGVGVQTIADAFEDKPVFPGNNTEFIGMMDRSQEKLFERCHACGDCVLDQFGGICPITRCAKGLLNGPCGGQVKGKCEVGRYTNDCAWVLIWKRLKQRGKLDQYTKFRPFRTRQHSPRELKLAITITKG